MRFSRVAVQNVFPQQLGLRIRGADVLHLESCAGPDEEAPIPDLGRLLVRAAQLGFFGGTSVQPWAASASVVSQEVLPDERQASWSLRLNRVDPGALHVAWNLLRALDLDEEELVTEQPANGVAWLDLAKIPYPAVHARLPFELEVEPSDQSSKDRSVQVVFLAPPPDAVVDELLAALDVWTQLLTLGGYPDPDTEPSDSGAFPDPPFQLDEVTVEQAFPEAFMADEAAFHAVVNHALTIHRSRHGVASVIVR